MNKIFGNYKKQNKPEVFEITKFFCNFFSKSFKSFLEVIYQHYPHFFQHININYFLFGNFSLLIEKNAVSLQHEKVDYA